jgi:ADP-heptose:LPS heptosyltransferase
MRKLILRNFLSPGDIVMLTAAVRDLHRAYPGGFITDVRTPCPDLWRNNPHITPLSETDPDVEVVDCHYPLIHQSNQAPWHFLHGFIDYLNCRLSLSILPTAFRGDIHLAEDEKPRAEGGLPVWIVAAGGKTDFTIKWWSTARYQQVVDHFLGRIRFIQIGEAGHIHPALDNVIDMRGRTTLRQLIRLVAQSSGVLTPVSLLMHLAAAVDYSANEPGSRPCVVVAGGREPPHWEAYPTHQFLHTVGMLRCCASGGCWKSRTRPLGDGQEHDHPSRVCVDVVDDLPRCMDMIRPEHVIDRIEAYLAGDASRPAPPQAAPRGRPAFAMRPAWSFAAGGK